MLINQNGDLVEVSEELKQVLFECALVVQKRRQSLLFSNPELDVEDVYSTPQWDVKVFDKYRSLMKYQISRIDWYLLSIEALHESHDWGQIFVPSDYKEIEAVAITYLEDRSNDELFDNFKRAIVGFTKRKFNLENSNKLYDLHLVMKGHQAKWFVKVLVFLYDSMVSEIDLRLLIHYMISDFLLRKISNWQKLEYYQNTTQVQGKIEVSQFTRINFPEASIHFEPIYFQTYSTENQSVKDFGYLRHLIETFIIDNSNKGFTSNFQKKASNALITEIDTIVKTHIKMCSNRSHDVVNMLAEVDVVHSSGEIVRCVIPASFCEQCNRYYILVDDFSRIKGIPLCKVIEVSSHTQMKELQQSIFGYQYQSVLHRFGYNVNANSNLTLKQRQTILIEVIKRGVLSRAEVISHLSFLLILNKTKPSFSSALRKWNTDKQFVSDFEISDGSYRLQNLYISK